ncbi:MAG: hypothetical protein P8Z50_00210 [candidate division WOR-3 bacterium]
MLVVCALFIAQIVSAQVWVPISNDLLNLESFRHQATAVIEDDLDNGIDGTDIFYVDGARIYTNLSNLATGMEQQGNNSNSANTVLLGATSPIYKGWKVTAFYANANMESTSFDGMMAETIFVGLPTNPEFSTKDFLHMDSTASAELS